MQAERLLEFEGYGGADPQVFFIGLGENSGDDAENLRRRLLFAPRTDLRRAHDLLFGPDWWERGSRKVPVWQVASQVRTALALGSTEGSAYEAEWRRIRDALLGRDAPGADTLLTELLPVPTSRNRTWPPGYRELLGYETYDDYRADQMPRRKEMLRGLLARHKPGYVFCYGNSDWPEFKDLFPAVPPAGWKEHLTEPSHAARPQAFQVARDGETTVVLTLHYGGRGRRFSRQHIESVLRAAGEAERSAVFAWPNTHRSGER